jgi:hypothetical protein
MKETLCLTVQSFASLFLIASIVGIVAGMYLVRAYVKARGSKTKAQKELTRLARFVRTHHPEAIREDSLVNIVMDLIKHPTPKETWRIE